MSMFSSMHIYIYIYVACIHVHKESERVREETHRYTDTQERREVVCYLFIFWVNDRLVKDTLIIDSLLRHSFWYRQPLFLQLLLVTRTFGTSLPLVLRFNVGRSERWRCEEKEKR